MTTLLFCYQYMLQAVSALQDAQSIARGVAEYGLDSHKQKLEREKMDIYFAQGKMALGRFVCVKP